MSITCSLLESSAIINMASGEVALVSLRRFETSQPWGFRMQGGAEFGIPLFIAQVSPQSIAGKAGAMNGDAILKIGEQPVVGWKHDQAKAEMMRAGNEVDLTVQRGVIDVSEKTAKQSVPVIDPRCELDETSIDPMMNEGSKFRDVQPKTYKMMEAEQAAAGDTPGARPASVFDRKKPKRSQYLQTSGSSIQKAYGQG